MNNRVWVRIAVAAALVCLPVRAPGAVCDLPDYVTQVDGALSRVPLAVEKEHKLRVLVVGTGSSALGQEGAMSAYPARLEAALAAALPKVAIAVSTDIKMRRTAVEMAAIMGKIAANGKPDLVVWQTGTVDAIRGIDPDVFRDALEAGIRAARAAGADVILVNMQYSPRTETMIAVQAYADAMHSVAQQQDVPLFDRLAAMKHWSESGIFDLAAPNRSRVAEKVHDCLGRALAQLIVQSGKLDRTPSKDRP